LQSYRTSAPWWVILVLPLAAAIAVILDAYLFPQILNLQVVGILFACGFGISIATALLIAKDFLIRLLSCAVLGISFHITIVMLVVSIPPFFLASPLLDLGLYALLVVMPYFLCHEFTIKFWSVGAMGRISLIGFLIVSVLIATATVGVDSIPMWLIFGLLQWLGIAVALAIDRAHSQPKP
jgi:hypothetical protein